MLHNFSHFPNALWTRLNSIYEGASYANFTAAREKLIATAEKARATQPPVKILRQFEQFIIASAQLWKAAGSGEVSEMGDWVHWALEDDPKIAITHEIDIKRLFDFHNDVVTSAWPNFHTVMVSYFTGLFDYARRRTAIPHVCLAFIGIAEETFEQGLRKNPGQIDCVDIQLGSFILAWAVVEAPDVAKRMAMRFEELAQNKKLSRRHRYRIALTLSTRAGQYSSRGDVYWAEHALKKFITFASEIDKAQLLCTVMKIEDKGAEDAERILHQMALARKSHIGGKSVVDIARSAAQTIAFVQPYFTKTFSMGRGDLLLRGLQKWYCQDDCNNLDAENVLFILPFGEAGSSTLCNGVVDMVHRETQIPLEKISRSMNAFLNTYTTVAGADNSNIPVPLRPGVPSELQSGLREDLQDAYCPIGLKVPENATSQLILPTEGHPIQATQLENWGCTWPISSSLANPKVDRKSRCALIWGGGTITEAMELDMVEHAFRSAGVRVERHSPETCSPEDFLCNYRREDFDILWIASHGEFNHWRPHEVQLQIASDGSSVDLSDLWGQAPQKEERRLLVLNVCDGARFSEPGLLPRVGLGPGLSAASQATISHLWPVRPYPSAVFGAFLAIFLAQGIGYFKSYVMTLNALRNKTETLAVKLEELYGKSFDLTHRLKTKDEDYSNIEVWGSVAFFQ